MVRFALLGLSAVALCSLSSPSETAIARKSRPSGFELPAIQRGYPGRTFQFDGEQAKLLVRELLPIVMNDVARVSVQENIMLPVGVYAGLTIDIALKVGVPDPLICEERHVYIAFDYTGPDVDVREMRPRLKDGAIANHVLAGPSLRNSYFTLQEKAASDDATLAKCRLLAANTSGWRQASSLSDYLSENRRLSALITALETLPMRQIRCVDPDGKPCEFERSKLLSLVRAALPERSESMAVPNEDAISVYRHYGYNDAAQVDYIATLRSGEADRPMSLDIRFSKSAPPPPV